jgi:shikimate dehydrogenase
MNLVFPWRDAPAARFAVIGDPVSHSLSPKMQNAVLRELGEPGAYIAIQVPEVEVAQALNHLVSLGFEGINVTVPNKAAARQWCKTVSEFASAAEAVNTIALQKQDGINTDGPGFVETISQLPGRRASVLGAGGSARAIVLSLSAAGYEVRLWNRTEAKARELAAIIPGVVVLAGPTVADADIVINATSASLTGAVLELDWTAADPEAVAYDLMYSSEPTAFLAAAGSRPKLDGRAMLVAQGALAMEFWLGRPVPREPMRRAVGL